jgi:hypothetical protein
LSVYVRNVLCGLLFHCALHSFVMASLVSCRVAACVAELTKLDLDVRSTAAYGVAHILCALTVTNRELRAAALADKDITPEQYEQMQELQRIKTKDEDGNVIEEKKVRIRERAAIIHMRWLWH